MQTILTALAAGLFPFFCTGAGAAAVFFLRRNSPPSLTRMVDGFAGGVMMAASVFSLLLPAIQASPERPWLASCAGLVLGAWLLLRLEVWAERLMGGRRDKGFRLFLGITLHNLPEGMVVGLAAASGGLTGAAALALGIGLQDLPEGAAVSLPLCRAGKGKGKAFGAGVLSGLPEPVGAVLAAAAAVWLRGAMPWALSLAAGAMICVTIQELLPDATGEKDGLTGFLAGFALMMAMDITF